MCAGRAGERWRRAHNSFGSKRWQRPTHAHVEIARKRDDEGLSPPPSSFLRLIRCDYSLCRLTRRGTDDQPPQHHHPPASLPHGYPPSPVRGRVNCQARGRSLSLSSLTPPSLPPVRDSSDWAGLLLPNTLPPPFLPSTDPLPCSRLLLLHHHTEPSLCCCMARGHGPLSATTTPRHDARLHLERGAGGESTPPTTPTATSFLCSLLSLFLLLVTASRSRRLLLTCGRPGPGGPRPPASRSPRAAPPGCTIITTTATATRTAPSAKPRYQETSGAHAAEACDYQDDSHWSGWVSAPA